MKTLGCKNLVIDIRGRADGDAINLDIRPGQVWGVLGPNGAGKTTLLHSLAGLRPVRRGQVLLAGVPLGRYSRRQVAQHLAVVFQDHHDSFPASVLETILIGRHPHQLPWDLDSAEDLALAREALARMELDGLEQRLVSTLSGGERQRLAIATALVQQPDIWLADEPINDLDLHHQVAVMDLLAEQAQAGCAVLACLHDLNVAAGWCSHLVLLTPEGEVCHGPAQDMLVPSALERLYRQKLTVGTINGLRVFVPAGPGSAATAEPKS